MRSPRGTRVACHLMTGALRREAEADLRQKQERPRDDRAEMEEVWPQAEHAQSHQQREEPGGTVP